ncbi:MAG: hypothetical protein HC896_03890 [Bacteroidales bacterium]|nr:hypothetical protein [Bacteroidales bacterium]
MFFVMTYYNKERHKGDNDFRYSLIKELKQNKDIKSVTGLVSNVRIPGKYGELQIPGYSYYDYMKEISRSKVAIYTRGVHECISFKLGQLMAMGMPMVGQKIVNNAGFYYGLPNFTEQLSYNSPKEIVDRLSVAIRDRAWLKEMSRSNLNLFNNTLLPVHFVKDLFKTINS